MAPTVHYADPDGREVLEGDHETGLIKEREGIVPNMVEVGGMEQPELKSSMEVPDQATASEIPTLNDGRRRSSRLRGKVALKSTGPGDGSPPVIKESSGSGKRGRRKKATGIESVRSIGDSVEELKSDVNVEAFPPHLAPKSENAAASPVGESAPACCAPTSGDASLPHDVGEEKVAKVKRLEDLDILDDSFCVEKEGTETAPPLVDTRSDFCDSIFENLQSIVILHPEENAIHNEIPSSSRRETEETIELLVADLAEANLKKEGSREEGTGLINVDAGVIGPDADLSEANLKKEGSREEGTGLINVDAGGIGPDADLSEANLKKEGSREEGTGLINVDAGGIGPDADLSEANLKKEGSREEGTGLINVDAGGIGTEKSAYEEVADLIIVQASSETTLQACKDLTGSETRPVVSDLKEEGISRGSNSSSKAGEDASKSNGNDGEDSSSVTSRDNVAQTTAASEDKDSKARSGDNARGGVSKFACKASLNDVHMATNFELLVEDTMHPQSRKEMPVHSKKPHDDYDQVGSRSSSEVKISRISLSKSRTSVLGSQVLVNGNEGKQNAFSSILEEKTTLQTASEIACPQSGEGEGSLQLGKKSDSLKSVNQEIGVCVGDVPGAMKVESSVEVTRSLSRHTENTVGGEDDSSGVTEGDVNTTSEKVDESVSISSKAGWVKCDDCKKWRSIPVDLAEKIGDTNAYWSCKENPNKQFADCSIPQVKSNEEINRDLGISESSFCDEEDEEEDETCDSRPMYNGIQENGQAVWTLIKRNIFKHRIQKHQDADEAMVCQCAPPKPGEVGCGEDCLNRMLNVECLPQQCPCGSLCTNQQFQKRCYANVDLFRCGKKGHGLRAKANISRGSFIIEYVGEVLDMPSFEARQKDYSMNSQKHFYFMTLSANEIIDACSKGNLGRFINHSCEPNCQTEKWMVDGEVCIGLFAIRDLKEGEEITFDYNFVRVGGADAKKCECGANKCRGFIGVDPDTPQNVVDIDSDDGEDPEPIMLRAESDEEFDGFSDKTKEGAAKKARMLAGNESTYENKWKLGGIKRKFYSGGAKDMGSPKKSRRVKTATISKIGSHRPAPSRLFAGSRFGIRSSYHSDVEEKLGELTNESGGLRKQRDAAKQYLKLLVLTAASGGTVNGAAACSARDLSMLLEALLKTQKSSLLKDIMNKNGLQMFHNLLKQFRKSFEKRPILRKLLKVLDHLAKSRVLTVEHIYSAPRSGTECFSDTLFDLSRHDDMEVQNMARNFRKLYVPPRPHKAVVNIERPLVKPPLQQTSVALSSPLVIESPQVGSSANNSADQPSIVQGEPVEENSANPPTASRRKRPSRWDTVTDSDSTVASVSVGMSNSGPASLHGAVRHQQGGSSEQASPSFTPRSHLPTGSGSQQAFTSDPSARLSMTSAPTGIPGRPSGPFSPFPPGQHMVQGGGLQHQVYPSGHIPVGLPGQRQAIPQGPMHLGMQRVPMGNELPPMAQRPYSGGKHMLSGPHPMQGGPLQIPAGDVHPLAFAYNRGHPNQTAPSIHGVHPGPWPLMHPMGGHMFGGPFLPPPPPLPPSGQPAWGRNGPRQVDGLAGHASGLGKEAPEASKGQVKREYPTSQGSSMKNASNERGESEGAGEPPVPGMSPESHSGSRASERTISGVPEPTQGSARSHNESSASRLEAHPHNHRDEYGARISGHDSNRSRSVPDSAGPLQQAYSYPDYSEGVQGKGQREMSWETPECSSFHHHVSGMVRARVEMKHLVHYKDVEKFCSKLTEVVTRKEIKKYKENKIQGMAKTILRSKLLEKVDAYVDLQIGLYSKSKSGEGQS